MAYGDTHFDPKGEFQDQPTTEGKILGKDAGGKDVVKDKKFLLDSGADHSSIDRENLKGMNVTYKGAVKISTASGIGFQDVFAGVTFQFQAQNAKGENVDLKCDEPFMLSRLPILGADQFKKTGAKLTLDYKKTTVTINGEKAE